MEAITRRGLVGAGMFMGMTALAGCGSQPLEPVEEDTESIEEPEPQESELTPEQLAIMEDGEPLSEAAISANCALSQGFATTDGYWDYICGGAGIYRLRPDGSELERVWEGDDFHTANDLCATGGALYFAGCNVDGRNADTIFRMDTDSLDTEGIRSFPEGSASGLDLVLAVIGGRVFFADSHYDDNGATVFSTALDGSDERELWSTVRSLPTYAFTEDAIWCAAGGADDPAIERFDLASLAAETLLDSSSGLTSVNRIVAIDDAIYFDAGLNGQPGIFKLEAGGEPVHVSSNHLLGATGGYLYAYGSPGERSLDVNYTFTRIDLATNEEVPFDYPEPYNTHNSSFQFYGFDSRLLINVGDRAYVVSPEGETLFQYTFAPEG